jgi:hypothetical protein
VKEPRPIERTDENVIRYLMQAEHGQSGVFPLGHLNWCTREAKAAYGIA